MLNRLKYAKDHGINMLCLPAHTSHILQVADLSVFKDFKLAWKSACIRHKIQKYRECADGTDRDIQRSHIIPLMEEAWQKSVTKENVVAGFKKAVFILSIPYMYFE